MKCDHEFGAGSWCEKCDDMDIFMGYEELKSALREFLELHPAGHFQLLTMQEKHSHYKGEINDSKKDKH